MSKKWLYLLVLIVALVAVAALAKGLHLRSKLFRFFTPTPTSQSSVQNTASPSGNQNY